MTAPQAGQGLGGFVRRPLQQLTDDGQVQPEGGEPLLGAVMQIPGDAAPLLVGGRHHPGPGRTELVDRRSQRLLRAVQLEVGLQGGVEEALEVGPVGQRQHDEKAGHGGDKGDGDGIITHAGVSPENPVTSCSTPRAATEQATARETPR